MDNIHDVGPCQALTGSRFIAESVQALRGNRHRERWRLAKLAALPFLRPWPSHTNFILCDVLRGDARRIRDRLREFGVFIRYFDTPLLKDCLRISVGLPRHTDQLIAALEQIGASLGRL